jgi:hypothetical protein
MVTFSVYRKKQTYFRLNNFAKGILANSNAR